MPTSFTLHGNVFPRPKDSRVISLFAELFAISSFLYFKHLLYKVFRADKGQYWSQWCRVKRLAEPLEKQRLRWTGCWMKVWVLIGQRTVLERSTSGVELNLEGQRSEKDFLLPNLLWLIGEREHVAYSGLLLLAWWDALFYESHEQKKNDRIGDTGPAGSLIWWEDQMYRWIIDALLSSDMGGSFV